MSYLALARKWRPHNFQEMAGQEHVLQPLMNALSQNRVHHAFLFTGTRGVGKTTLSRILAKSLNCEVGVTATPCGQCINCRQIDEGNFVDLIEIDAASRTKVEDTRELLESVQYVPHRGRYKVYVIDEVHALSGHSFNALLKTLEEPPPHTKFILATTDPQKIPVTVLSRCLQFHLKHLTVQQVFDHLIDILNQEKIKHDPIAIKKIAKAAQGSMRDALSLLDQAIAFCGEEIAAESIDQLLGSIQTVYFYQLMDALCSQDAQKVFIAIDTIAEHTSDFEMVLEELLATLHQIAILQLVPGASIDFSDPEKLQAWANQFSSEAVQLLYQIALIGKRDLPLAPSKQVGFEMLLLRMLFFTREEDCRVGKAEQSEACPPFEVDGHSAINTKSRLPSEVRHSDEACHPNKACHPSESWDPAQQPQDTPVSAEFTPAKAEASVNSAGAEGRQEVKASQVSPYAETLQKLNLTGITKTLASYCVLKEMTSTEIHLLLDTSQSLLLNEKQRERLEQAFNHHYGASRKLVISIGEGETLSPAMMEKQQQNQRHQAAVEKVAQDSTVKEFLQAFDAQLLPENVKLMEE